MQRQLWTAAAASWKNVSDTVLVLDNLHMEVTSAGLETLSFAHWHGALSDVHNLIDS